MIYKSLAKLFGMADAGIYKLGCSGQKGTRRLAEGLSEKLSKTKGPFSKADRAAYLEELHTQRVQRIESSVFSFANLGRMWTKMDPTAGADDLLVDTIELASNNLRHGTPSKSFAHSANNPKSLNGTNIVLKRTPNSMSDAGKNVVKEHLDKYNFAEVCLGRKLTLF